MGLIRVPLLATVLGVIWLFFGAMRLQAISEPSVATWCGDPALAELEHVRLGLCSVGIVLVESSGGGVWVALHRPTAPSPSVLVHLRGVFEPDVIPVVSARLARGELDVARTEPSGRTGDFSGFPDVRTAVFVGEARDAGSTEVDTTTLVFLGLGALFVLADVIRLGAWIRRRVLGR